jgi:hypothetical protein
MCLSISMVRCDNNQELFLVGHLVKVDKVGPMYQKFKSKIEFMISPGTLGMFKSFLG